MGLVTEYPAWLILFCILTGAAYAVALYFRTKEDELARWLKRLLALFRFLSVFLISFLLLSPMIKRSTTTVEKPVVIVGLDNSSSMLLNPDSVWLKENVGKQVQELEKKLGKKFELRTYVFGDHIRAGRDLDFSDKMTNISELFRELESIYANRNVGAVVIVSDGIYNQGISPVYAAEKIPWPVYTVAAGDTIKKNDVLIRKSVYNRTAYKGDRFPVEVYLEAAGYGGQQARLSILKGKEIVAERTVLITGNAFTRTVGFLIDARETGMQHYTLLVTPLEGEFTVTNNRSDVYIEVVETRQKVAILYQSPHPDIAAIRAALEKSGRYEISVSDMDQFSNDPKSFDLLVLYQLPSMLGKVSLMKLSEAGTSLLFVIGAQTDLNDFNKLNTGLVINAGRSGFSEVQPVVNESFPLFTLNREAAGFFGTAPPLISPFGTYQTNPLAEVLFYQRIGNTTTQFPLVMFFSDPQRKTGIIAGENMWRWRINDYVANGNFDTYDELIGKIVQYLSIKEEKSFFRVKSTVKFSENDDVTFEAEVYNDSYELINTPDVRLIITDEEGREFPFLFGKIGSAYTLNAGSFPAGEYAWKATVNNGSRTIERSGVFVVAPLQFESLNTIADHHLLRRLASSHDGKMVFARDMGQLGEIISSRPDVSSVSHSRKIFDSLIGNLWLFLLIISLLTVEWAIRKRSGI